MARNRIIYQSEALFVSPSSTGYHLQKGGQGAADTPNVLDDHSYTSWTGITEWQEPDYSSGPKLRSLTMPLERIQSANFNFAINRTDINEFGKLARLDSIVMESPTVGLDFNYYLTDGGNERKLGFNVPTSALDGKNGGRGDTDTPYSTGDLALSGYSALSGLIEDPQGNNYFILVTKEGKDVQSNSISASNKQTEYDVVSIGNGFISDYTIEAAVGSIPTASATVEAFNIKVEDTASGDASTSPISPWVNIENGAINSTQEYFIQGSEAVGNPLNISGASNVAALRPGDITLTIGDANAYDGIVDLNGDGQAHIQSMTISVPMSRTVLQRLGNTFGYARVIDLPLNIEVSISAIVSELNNAFNLYDNLCHTQKHTFTLDLKDCNHSTGQAGSSKIKFEIKNARLDSETFSNAIGDNETVDMTFSCQLGGAKDTANGLFIYGSYPLFRTLPFYPLGKNKGVDGSYTG